MANPTLLLQNITVNQGGEYVYAASDFTGADGDGDFSHYKVTTLPTKGQILKNGVPLALNGTFTEADLTAGAVAYVHDGQAGDEDSAAFVAVDAAAGESAPSAQTITVTDGAWLLTFVASGLPNAAVLVSTQAAALLAKSRLEGHLSGAATVVFLAASIATGLTVNHTHTVDLLIALRPQLNSKHHDEIARMAERLIRALARSENSDLETLVTAHGAALELENVALDDAQSARWRNIRQEIETVPARFAYEVPYHLWYAALDEAKALLA